MSVPRMNSSAVHHASIAVFRLPIFCRVMLVAMVSVSMLMLWRAAGATGSASSSPAPIAQGLRVDGFDVTDTATGQQVVILGAGFKANPNHLQNEVYFKNNGGTPVEVPAEIVSATADKLTVLTPHNAITGKVRVAVPGQTPPSAESPAPLPVRTSISGIVQDDRCSSPGIPGVNILAPSEGRNEYTKAQGIYVLELPQTRTTNALTFEVDAKTAHKCYEKQYLTTPVAEGADTRYPGYIKLKVKQTVLCFLFPPPCPTPTPTPMPVVGPTAVVAAVPPPANSLADAKIGQSSTASVQTKTAKQNQDRVFRSGEVVLEVPAGAPVSFPDGASKESLSLGVFERERTPVPLPQNIYSSAIVQISPFGHRIEPGATLTFPNLDGISEGARLFHFDQDQKSPTLGRFVDVGAATLSADKKWVKTEPGAIKETGYYFVSQKWKTTTLEGRVKGGDGRPVSRAIVIARGQFAFTDDKGVFKLPYVAIVGSGQPATVEITYLRPDGQALSRDRAGVALTPIEITRIEGDFILPSPRLNPPPVFDAPASLEIREDETRSLKIKVRDDNKIVRVDVSGAKFAAVTRGGFLWCKNFRLRLTPKAGDAGNYKLVLSAVDSFGVKTLQSIAVRVNKR